MFTKGRIIFVIFFVIAFVIGLVIAYRKDISERASNFKGSKKITLTIFLFFFLFVAIIQSLKFF